MKVYLLIQDFDYEGYGMPEFAWGHYPSREEILAAFITMYYPRAAFDNNLEQHQTKFLECFDKISEELFEKKEAESWALIEMDMVQ